LELYRKYRPQNLKQMVGNASTIKALQNYINKDSLPHCILLTGPTGCGKTTIARIIKNVVQADDKFGYRELDASVFRGIDTARELSKEIIHRPIKGKAKVILLDECHNFGIGGASEKNLSQNAILKTLESCPEWAYFILCTTNPEMLIPTLKGRCTNFAMETLQDKDMRKLLITVAKKEKKKIDKEVSQLIIDNAFGHPRNALQILSKTLVLDNLEDMKKAVKEEIQKKAGINQLCYALLDGKKWPEIRKIIDGLKDEQPETIRRGMLGMLSSALVKGWGDYKKVNPFFVMSWFIENNTYDSGMAGIVYICRAITDKVGAE